MNWISKIQQAISFIEQNLLEDITIEAVGQSHQLLPFVLSKSVQCRYRIFPSENISGSAGCPVRPKSSAAGKQMSLNWRSDTDMKPWNRFQRHLTAVRLVLLQNTRIPIRFA